ncbi:hypothetical protein SAMN06264365_103371 [Actinoplanes regularis]|uniref:PilZ domain-containing protein n=1 Tax=Actinoplanes regularis TaxID=52697 RepID=A0A238XEF2_9ACTN|nr:hypothetical protein Are01nite_32230 [Actinoplanes regularis]SNR57376.1 hypothetical protein SAMN06264365_103371 [Actinoplanes regularis]
MSSSLFPQDGLPLELEAAGVVHPEVRVVTVAAKVVTVSLPLAEVPLIGSTVTVRWAAPRGKYAVPATVIGIDENRVELRAEGVPQITQSRLYVRGGGGEPIVMTRAGQEATGLVQDISEGAVRARFPDFEVEADSKVTMEVQLGSEVINLSATVAKVSPIHRRAPGEEDLSIELIALYQLHESQAKIIRGYIMQLQRLERAKANESI